MDQPIDLITSSDDDQSSGPVRPRKPNGSHHRNDGRTPPDTVDLTIDEPDCDPYRTIRSLLSLPGSLQKPYRAPAGIPRELEHTISRTNGVVSTSQGPEERHIYTAGASNVDFRANSAAWTPAPPGPYRFSVAPAPSMGVHSDAAVRPASLGQSSGTRPPIDFATPLAPLHLNATTPAHDLPAAATQSKAAIPMHPHPHPRPHPRPQSPGPARISPKLESAYRSQLYAPSAAQGDRGRSPLPKPNALWGVPRNVRSTSPDRKAETDSTLNMSTRLEDPGRSSFLPLTIESFQECLQKAIRELRRDHQYYVKVINFSRSTILPADQS